MMGEVISPSTLRLFANNKVSSIDLENSPPTPPIAFSVEEPSKSRSLSISSKRTDPISSLKLVNPPRPQLNW